MPYNGLWWRLIILFGLLESTAFALTFDLPLQNIQVIGDLQLIQTLQGDNFDTLSRRYGVGYHEIMEANPKIPSDNIEVGTIIVLPTRFILPGLLRTGIVINLAELRLYYYHENKVYTYPIGVGRAGWDTPLGPSYILGKLKNPTWYVPKSIQEASKKEGLIIPDRVLPGKDNPLGPYALRLHYHNYLIHGTNEAEGVGRRSTAGCVRMFPEDITELFERVHKGTLVSIINQPYKVGWDEKKELYLEAHLPFTVTNIESSIVQKKVAHLVNRAMSSKKVLFTWDSIHSILRETLGVPIKISTLE